MVLCKFGTRPWQSCRTLLRARSRSRHALRSFIGARQKPTSEMTLPPGADPLQKIDICSSLCHGFSMLHSVIFFESKKSAFVPHLKKKHAKGIVPDYLIFFYPPSPSEMILAPNHQYSRALKQTAFQNSNDALRTLKELR